MKQTFLILIAIFSLVACSNDDDNSSNNQGELNYDLVVSCNIPLDLIEIKILDNNNVVIQTHSVENQAGTALHINSGTSFTIKVYKEYNFNSDYGWQYYLKDGVDQSPVINGYESCSEAQYCEITESYN